jgi:hypothetical protein
MSAAMNIPGLFNTKKSYIVLNTSDTQVEITYDSVGHIIPPNNVLGSKAGRDALGNPIPGTVVISDIMGERLVPDDGPKSDRWDAAQAIKHALRINPETHEGSGPYVERGVTLIAEGLPPEEIAKIRAAAREKFVRWQYENDRTFIGTYAERASKHKVHGLEPPSLPVEYDVAVARVRKFRDKEDQRLNAGLEVAGIDSSGEDLEALKQILLGKIDEIIPLRPNLSKLDKWDMIAKLLEDKQIREMAVAQLKKNRAGQRPRSFDSAEEEKEPTVTEG